jgi:error-prone DNA polymerase
MRSDTFVPSAGSAIHPPRLLATTRIDWSHDPDLENPLQIPDELVPAGETPTTHLRTLTVKGLARRYPQGAPDAVVQTVEHELRLIGELAYEPFFLTVNDIVEFARGKAILCQGRGSAANSSVCYCLGITEVDPGRMSVLFERFISKERNEPPDIDVDFEHQRREEVIQYIYAKYGRERAAIAAVVITYQPRSALRDVGKALGLSLDQVDLLSKSMSWWDDREALKKRLEEGGFDLSNRVVQQVIELTQQLVGFPRHLSHIGGFVIDNRRLSRLVPVENVDARSHRDPVGQGRSRCAGPSQGRRPGLGMLSIRRAIDLGERPRRGRERVRSRCRGPGRDPAVYDDPACRHDRSLQIESRAQISCCPA